MKRIEILTKELFEYIGKHRTALMGLSMSIGIAFDKKGDISLEEMLQHGDEALYYSKEHGRDRFCFYEDIG